MRVGGGDADDFGIFVLDGPKDPGRQPFQMGLSLVGSAEHSLQFLEQVGVVNVSVQSFGEQQLGGLTIAPAVDHGVDLFVAFSADDAQ